uniref:Uncharacterized protein n=1 Tax=Podoviridae sp. ctiuS14 TaxID=2827620 RepID=A0A8S5LMK6_9CAUD|nr:MAG TPA: hypothetical protein [Podoviridae sp. ctiuS14]
MYKLLISILAFTSTKVAIGTEGCTKNSCTKKRGNT